ncbi:MAG TPA: hypothetical protein VE890_02360 [Thermoguttaceae bacterium]|nr:hypothetical protein [Thermoguttaceae bacterium]
MPNNEDNQPDFEQLDDLFDESPPEAEGPTEPADDPLGSLDSLDSDPFGGDSGLGDIDEGAMGFSEDTAEQEEDPKGKKSKKRKKKEKKKKVKAKKETAPKKEKVPKQKKEPGERAGLLETLQSASPYTVMLGLTLLAILIAILCHLKELMDYDLDINAEGYKQQARLDPGSSFEPVFPIETHV